MTTILDERGFPDETLAELFALPDPLMFKTSDQATRALGTANAFRAMAAALRNNLAVSADRTDAIRKLRELRTLAFDAIRLEEVRR
jgi:hypothetical protein